jgi:SulP family sulfate permease
MLVPKLFTTFRTYSWPQLARDLAAGVVVGIVALPLAIAFAIASGVTPDRGLVTAIVAGFLISALGGSRVQIGGPTGAFVIIVYGIVQQHGVQGLMIATMMAGVGLIVLGVARVGAAIKFIPFPVTVGFTSGIALLIFSGQIKDLCGLDLPTVPPDFFAQWRAYAGALGTAGGSTLAVAALSLAILALWPRWRGPARRVPAPFVALVVGTAVTQALRLPVETIGDRFGAIHATLPRPSLPTGVTLHLLRELSPAAFTIAMLAAIESLLSAVVADGMIGGRHRSNMELVAQGVANVVTPLFGGLPATGAIARTATNVRNGGRTPIAGITHAVTLLLITLFFARWVGSIPLAVLAAILVVVAYHMSEWRTFLAELRAPRSDVAVLLATFLLTVLVDLTVAIQVGLVLAAFLFMRRMAEVTNVSMITREMADAPDETDPNATARRDLPDGVVVYEINGPFFFGAADRFRDTLGEVAGTPRVLIIRMRNVPAMDSTGLRALTDVYRKSVHAGTLLLLSDVHAQPMMALARSELLDQLGDENLFGNLDDALNRAREHLGLPAVPKPPWAQPTVRRESGPQPTEQPVQE